MDKVLRPERFDAAPSTPSSEKEFKHWFKTFESFCDVLPDQNVDKLKVITNFISPTVYEVISEATTYDVAVEILKATYQIPTNEVFARHTLATRRQQAGESLDQFLQTLHVLSRDCNFVAVDAKTHKEDAIRDAFITGIESNTIKQRLLEGTKNLKDTTELARSLDIARKSADACNRPVFSPVNATSVETVSSDSSLNATQSSNYNNKSKCWNCGNFRHPKARCPARDAECHKCGISGHFAKCCRNNSEKSNACYNKGGQQKPDATSSAIQQCYSYPTLATIPTGASLNKSICHVSIDGQKIDALIDSGSTNSFIHPRIVEKLSLKVCPELSQVSMASASFSKKVQGCVFVNMLLNERTYKLKLSVLDELCVDIILGLDFQANHEKVTLHYGGKDPPLDICALSTMNVTAPALFENLSKDCKPIAMKSRRYSTVDQRFIREEVSRLLNEDIIEHSKSSWRAQVVVTKETSSHKKRLCIDYSQTINKFTELDAFPLPHIEETVEKMGKFKVFTSIDLKSAYHQLAINDEDKVYTAFEADGNLYQFKRLPFGLTNGVPCFQRTMSNMVLEAGLQEFVFPYLDNVYICGNTQEEHDNNLEKWNELVAQKNITYNKDKCTFSTSKLVALGYVIEGGEIKPDPERMRPLRELPLPTNAKRMKSVVGLFSYYSKWISHFSDKIAPLVKCKTFPVNEVVAKAFSNLKLEIEESAVGTIDESLPFVVETDASDIAFAAVLNQGDRPVAFFARTLHDSELKHPPVEKEAGALIEAVRHWRHYLTGKHFTLVTDQQSVSYIFDKKHKNKIKNDKMNRWRTELSCYSFDIIYRPGKENVVADSFTRVYCNAVNSHALHELHASLCHPGVTRFYAFIQSRNLPYSLEEVRSMTKGCRVCCECKPRFHRAAMSHLIKSTQPWERLNLDFKGPFPSTSTNKFILTVVDEYSRFPFAIPCKDVSTESVIIGLSSLFSLFGMPAYIHSDRGSGFMSKELKDWLSEKGIATSRTTPYNPKGNGQAERYNGTIWKGVTMALKARNLPIKYWEQVLPDVLHSIRTLLCKATNCTPHERMFSHQRRSSSGCSLPSFLREPGLVLLRRHVRRSKYDPLTDEVELIEANPQYAHIRYPNGRESTVSLRDLAPAPPHVGRNPTLTDTITENHENTVYDISRTTIEQVPGGVVHMDINSQSEGTVLQPLTENLDSSTNNTAPPHVTERPLRRSTRVSKAPDRLDL